jgi:hypothetical protein
MQEMRRLEAQKQRVRFSGIQEITPVPDDSCGGGVSPARRGMDLVPASGERFEDLPTDEARAAGDEDALHGARSA